MDFDKSISAVPNQGDRNIEFIVRLLIQPVISEDHPFPRRKEWIHSHDWKSVLQLTVYPETYIGVGDKHASYWLEQTIFLKWLLKNRH